MSQQAVPQVENNFTKGLLTEFTGLNFPENASTDCDNCLFTLVGNITRREGIDFEENFGSFQIDRTGVAVSTFKWNNVGGDGLTQLEVSQSGRYINFWSVTAATVADPLSTQLLSSSVDLESFVAAGAAFDPTKECQFTDGNGYLFIFHPTCDPIYCTYASGTITANAIIVKIRDFVGVPEPGVSNNLRPLTLSQEHLYNLINQGWVSGSPWSGASTSTVAIGTGARTYIIATGLTISAGQSVAILGYWPAFMPPNPPYSATATVTSYNSGTGSLVVSVSSFFNQQPGFTSWSNWTITPITTGYINTWFSDVGNYPSNADVWWNFKDETDVFNPTTTLANTTIGTGSAPSGSMILNAFQQTRSSVSSVSGITDVTTPVRPRTGCWFQGRLWYTGVDASFPASGDMPYSTWTENIYFSQVVQSTDDFGHCYQLNDPTSEDLFDLLPTDGGVIVIQGAGSIYKLFPVANGLLVFASNGVWFITGSQGIGFSANDYTQPNISHVQCLSSTSFVDVQGLPYFWNEEGIYAVMAQQTGSLSVEPITVGTILTFYDNIPTQSKRYARAAYDPINYVIQWIYKSTFETSVTDRYAFDSILNFNTYNKAFYPYSVDISNASINSITYISSAVETEELTPQIMYYSTYPSGGIYGATFAVERDASFVDWASSGNAINYVSYFITGYRLIGQAQRRIQIPYIYTFSRGGLVNTSFYIQSIWDYATSGNSGRWSTRQQVNSFDPNYSVIPRRTRLRGQGLALQFKITSVDGQLFDLMGWSTYSSANTGV